ncbi:3-hydroxy-9,10-secoandrosta-1,3,5(10)-triene-9,17-dione monooxygenase [Actinocorallia herbida]|uniref:3-hydroxy-9,10-secoandrosta-1,3,5(10)-triene-9, 17-dione monooxygenase n=1 Tax=Actinocorallia herbida TaxID=58109 RepID=A0A3N1CWD7_9ACTN|nr:acyl-CoA dehydrogenase family protein [Actinocorallia herbida]ROO85609.1 3-hydroxy-9,10-secoandrosta-1,3,5(10)-triene-9,17-dione monooxygenase [Actinocorallia herbida]
MTVLDEIRRLEPEFRAEEELSAEQRSLTDRTFKHMQETGLMRGLLPERWGGAELSLREHLTSVYELGRVAPSAGWVAGVMGSHPWQLSLFPEETQAEIWEGNPDWNASSSYAPTGKIEPVPGGYKVSGRWSFSSGSDHAQGVILGGFAGKVEVAPGVEVPNYGSALLFRDEYVIEDTWHVRGSRGTGSKDIVVADVLIPERRFLSSPLYEYNPERPAPGMLTNPGSLYKLPWAVMFNLVLVAPMLGLGRRFLDDWTAETSVRKANWGGTYADDALMQMHLAEAEWIHDAAVAKMYNAIDTITQAAEAGVHLERQERARMRWNITKGCQEVGFSINKLMRVASGRTVFVDHPLHRLYQDVVAELGHAFLVSDGCGQYYGAALLGSSAPEVML